MKKYNEEQLMAALELDPGNAKHVYTIGCKIFENKDELNHYSHAVDVIKRAIVLEPMNGAYHFKMAAMHIQHHCWNQSYRYLEACITLNYKKRTCEKLLKETKIKEDEYLQKQNEQFVKTKESMPDDAAALAQLGHHYSYKDKARAYDYYKKALKLNPGEMEANCGIGRLYASDGDMENAYIHIKKGFGPNEYDDHDNHYNEMARMYEDNDDWKNALVWRQKDSEAYPGNVSAMKSLAWAYFKVNMDKECAELYLKVLALAPGGKNREAYMFLPGYYHSQGDMEKVREYILLGVKFNPGDYYLLYNLGRFCYMTGEFKESEKYFLHSLSFKPDSEPTLEALGKIYITTDELFDKEKSKKYFLKLLEINRDNLPAHQSLGKIFEEDGNIKKAEYHINRERQLNILQLLQPSN